MSTLSLTDHSIIRVLRLSEKHYYALLRLFHSPAVNMPSLTATWTRIVLRMFGVHVVRTSLIGTSAICLRDR